MKHISEIINDCFEAALISKAYRDGQLKPHDMSKDVNTCNCCGHECHNNHLRMCGECTCVSCSKCRCEGECPNCNSSTWALS